MIFSPEERRSIIVESELYALRAMCQGTAQRSVFSDGRAILSNYPFLDADHQLLYDTLCEMNTEAPERIRSLLPARLTKKGFPDFDIQTFFQPHNLAADVAVSMMEGVQFSARGKTRFPVH